MIYNKPMGRDMNNYYAWRKKKFKRLPFDLNREAEQDVIEHLDKQPNKHKYLIDLIRADMKKSGQ